MVCRMNKSDSLFHCMSVCCHSVKLKSFKKMKVYTLGYSLGLGLSL